MPGLVSETYLRPADSAASFGSTIVCTSAADSNKAITSPAHSKNLMKEGEFHRSSRSGRLTIAPHHTHRRNADKETKPATARSEKGLPDVAVRSLSVAVRSGCRGGRQARLHERRSTSSSPLLVPADLRAGARFALASARASERHSLSPASLILVGY